MPFSLMAYCFGVALLLVVAVLACMGGVVLSREAPHTEAPALMERTGSIVFIFGLVLIAIAVAILFGAEPHLVVR